MMIHIILLFFVGIVFGSFLNAWVWRTHVGLSVLRGRSLCPSCRIPIRWFDNIPLVSFLLLWGACRSCRRPISFQYPLVESMSGILFVVLGVWAWQTGVSISSPLFLIYGAVTYILLFVFMYDVLYREIPDIATLYPAAILFIITLVFGWQSWSSMLLGIVIAAGFFWLQYAVSGGRWIGGGDVRLGVLMGVVLGYPRVIAALMIAYVVGALVSLMLVALKKKHMASETPFGTYLALATFVMMLWGEQIIGWYIRMISL